VFCCRIIVDLSDVYATARRRFGMDNAIRSR